MSDIYVLYACGDDSEFAQTSAFKTKEGALKIAKNEYKLDKYELKELEETGNVVTPTNVSFTLNKIKLED